MGELKQQLEKFWFAALCLGLIAIGILGLYLSASDHPVRELIASGCHALIIAGVLALTVDRFVKWRLLRELTKDVSQFLIGYELPAEIRDRIHDLMGTSLVRHNYEQRHSLTIESNRVTVEVEGSWYVVNYSSTPRPYLPELRFHSTEHPEVKEIACHTTDRTAAFVIKGDGLRHRTERDGSSIRVRGKEIWVHPRASGMEYRIFVRYVVKPADSLYTTAMGMPTIGIMMSTECADALKVSIDAMAKPTIDEGDRWECRQLFMPGEHVTLKWERTKK